MSEIQKIHLIRRDIKSINKILDDFPDVDLVEIVRDDNDGRTFPYSVRVKIYTEVNGYSGEFITEIGQNDE